MTVSGKPDYKICSYETDHVELIRGIWTPSTYSMRSSLASRVVREFIEIPCGKCTGCRLDYSRQWAYRCMLELEYHDEAHFVTLTYNDDHIPVSAYGDPSTGEAIDAYTLDKRDFQLFMKRLRKAFPDDDIRYYACGEYGSTTFRPHYHAIIYGLHLDDLVECGRSSIGHPYYTSPKLQRVWSIYDPKSKTYDPIGFVSVGDVTVESCAYVARYIMKKQKGDDAVFYDLHNVIPEFTLMSRKPGIGRQWYDDHPDLYDFEYINLKTNNGGLKFRPPRYYDKLFDIVDPDRMKQIKEIRKRAAQAQTEAKLKKTDLSYTEMLEVEERKKSESLKKLVRCLE